jgi:murein DD-endopeptidase MepM/ murein hydrolase activator NlpD
MMTAAKIQHRLLSLLCLSLLGFGLASGCASVQPESNDRKGLFSEHQSRRPAESPHGFATTQVVSAKRGGHSENLSPEAVAAANKLNLHWPLRHVQITSRFGKRLRDFHEGIDLKARAGTPVYAAQEGRVLYAGVRIRGYGKMIVIKHAYGIATVYAHNSKLLVGKGDYVKLGQQIATSGNTGHTSGPHVHFEVRHGVSAVDPARLVPLSRVAWADEAPAPKNQAAARIAER